MEVPNELRERQGIESEGDWLACFSEEIEFFNSSVVYLVCLFLGVGRKGV